MQNKNNAFTLIELIVVITILAILGTIAFLSFKGYNSNARDSVRSTDLSLISNSLEIFQVKSGTLPETNSGTNITYSGGLLAWTQGSFSDKQRTQVNDLNKVPLDPLTQIEYTYSVTNMKNEFELGAAYEGNRTQNKEILKQSYADSKIDGIARVAGNYNGVLLPIKDPNSDIFYIVAVPTIINGNLSWDTIENILANKSLVTNGGNTLPSGYSGSKFNTNKTNDNYNPNLNNILVYSGSLNDLTTNENKRINLGVLLQNAYSGSIIGENSEEIGGILNTSIDENTPSGEAKNLVRNILKNYLKLKVDNIPISSISTSTGGTGSSTPVDPYALPSDLVTIFGSGSAWTQNWTNNSCNTSAMSVVELSPGTDVIPQNLSANTIYKLSSGDYISSTSINMNNCSGIIGVGNINIYSSVVLNAAWWDPNSSIIYSNGKINFILSGININGEQNGIGGTHTRNTSGIFLMSSNNSTILDVDITKSNYGLFGYFFSNSYIENLNSFQTGQNIYLDNSSQNKFKNLSSYSSEVYGIYLSGGSGNEFNNINIYNNGYHPVYYYYGYSYEGISVGNGSTGNKFENGKIYGNAGNGVSINSNNLTLNKLKIFNNGRHGIEIGSSNHIIENITSYNNNGQGIAALWTGYNNTIISNIHSYNNTDGGVGLSGNNNTLTNANIHNNGNNGGLFFIGDNNILSNSYIYNNSWGLNSVQYLNNSIFNGVNIYKNTNNGTTDIAYGTDYHINSSNTYYSALNIFGNTYASNQPDGPGASIVVGNGSSLPSKLSDLTLANGVVGSDVNEENLPSDYFINTDNYSSPAYPIPSGWTNTNNWYSRPSISGWTLELKGKQTGLTFDGNETYEYGKYIAPQARPVKWNTTTSKFEYYGTDGVDYDTTKHIGQW